MAKLTDKINELIALLDTEEDKILIIALKSKLYQEEQQILSKYDVSEKEIINAKKGVQKTLQAWKNEEFAKNKRLCKINTILNNVRECENCKNSITKKYYQSIRHRTIDFEYKTYDINNLKCISCNKRVGLLENEKYNEKYLISLKYDKEIPLEFYKQKALITKIQNKLSIIKKNGKL